MRINHNLQALNTYGRLSTNTTNASNNLQKLSSGLRINKAGDDAAGLAISEKMRAQIRGLDQAGRNAQDGISMIQTAEGALNETHSILQRMRELADQSANGTNTADDRQAIQAEVGQLKNEIDRIGNTTEFNTQKLLNGSLSSTGAAQGTNTTTSAVISKLSSASMVSGNTLKKDMSSMTWGKDTFTIDGHDIEVDWNTLLTQSQKDSIKVDLTSAGTATLENVKNTVVNALNQAIDNYNSTNTAGANVAHVSAYLNTANKVVLSSGTTGVDSQIQIDTTAATTVGALMLSDSAGADSANQKGNSIYNGTTVAQNTTLSVNVNGVNLTVTLATSAITNGSTSMVDVASYVQKDLNDAISAYNVLQGKTSGQEGYIQATAVTASKDGRLVVSSESGPVSFADLNGKSAVKDLGLTQAQTEASGNGGMTFQIGANKNQTINFGIKDMRTAALGLSGVDVSTAAGASNALTSLDSAIKSVSSERSKLGAVQNRLEHTISNLSTSSENLTAAESRVRDVDMAKEMMEFTKNNILTQAAQGMLSQANQSSQGVLSLLR